MKKTGKQKASMNQSLALTVVMLVALLQPAVATVTNPGTDDDYSLDFSLSGSAEVSDFGFTSGSITVEMFFKLHEPDDEYDWIWIGDHSTNPSTNLLYFGFNNSNIGFEIDGVGQPIGISYTPPANEWHHAAAVYDGNSLRYYINGFLQDSYNTSDTFNGFSNQQLEAGWSLDGLGDVIRISDIARYDSNFDPWSQDFIADGNTVLLWHCNENGGNVLNDDSGNNNTGTFMSGTPEWSSDTPWSGGGTGEEYSYDFGMGGHVEVFDGTGANDLDNIIDFSIEFFIMFHANPGTDQILFERLEPAGANNDMELRWDNSAQQFELSLGTEGVHFGELFVQGINPFDSNWHHIYIQYMSVTNRLEFFWDGVLTSFTEPTAVNPSIPGSDYPLRFGTDLAASLDEIRIRTTSEDYGSSFPIPTAPYASGDVDANTIVLWHCNENGGNDLIDDGFYQNNTGWVIGTGSWDGSNPWSGGGGGGGPSYIDVTSPNSMSNWSAGTGESIEWNSTSDGNYAVDIELWKEGSLYELIESGNPSESWGSSYWWTIPAYLEDGNDYEIRVLHVDSGVDGFSDNFQISGGGGGGDEQVTVYWPNGGEFYTEGDLIPISWGWTGASIGLDIYLSRNSGGSFDHFIGSANATDESYNWTIPDGVDSPNCRISIEDPYSPATNDASDNDFTILDSGGGGADHPIISNFTITSPNAYTDGDAPVDISVELDASTGISEAKIQYYKGGNDGNILESNLAETGSTWTGSISAGDVSMEGLMAQVFAKSNNGDEMTSSWTEIPVYFNEYVYNSIAAGEYAMVSFPGDLDSKNVKSVLENALGSYDPTQWRSFSYNNSSESYDENSGSFKAGNAFWVISRVSDDLSGGSGQVTTLEETYSITLDQGWNMVGNPYAFDVNFSDHITSTGDVEMTLYGYDGSGYVSETEMIPGDGYWIWSNENGATLEIDHISSGGFLKQMAGGWQIGLGAAINGYHDTANKLGTHPLARNERDGMDFREPPVIGDYVQLAFDNADWKDKGSYSKDIRKKGQASYIWNIAVKSNMSGQIRLDAMDAINIPLEYDALLIDLENSFQHDLRSGETYNYVSIGDEQPHQLQVIIGFPENVSKIIDDLAILPTEFAVDQNVPNPFNPVTAIRMQLVEDAVVSMKIFNILGEEVAVLLHNAKIESGYQQVIWNGRDKFNRKLPSGLYLYQTIMKNDQGKLLHMKTNKMIMVK